MSILNKSELIQRFQLHQTVNYQPVAQQAAHPRDPSKLAKAAVLIGFVERADGLKVIFTKRANHLRHHPGQVSFPGGKLESFDQSLAETALRETFEEVGISRKKIEIFGQMPQLITRSQFAVTPFLAIIDANFRSKIDTNEVAELFEIPLQVVLDKNRLRSHPFTFKRSVQHIFALSHQKHFIWGMTAQIIAALQQQLMQ